MLITFGAIVVLLFLSAFFSGSETALTAASRPLMHQLEQGGDQRAKLVNVLHARKERLIGTILLGNNLVNILASALATSAMITMFGETGIAYATLGMTLLVLIFAEVLPKTYAFHNANRMALTIAPIVSLLVWVLSPFTHAINMLILGVVNLFGGGFETRDILGSGDEELRGAIELHEREDVDVRHERAMLRSVLDLAQVQVGEVMTHRKQLVTIDASLTTGEIIAQALESPYTRLPLWRDNPDNVVGILHAKALLRLTYNAKDDVSDVDIMSVAAEPWFVPETTTLQDQLEAFRERREHSALVIDEYGAIMGIVTLEDILEEIVGDIADEHDIAVSGVRADADGSYIIDGTVTIRDLNRELDWDLPDEEASTVAGLVLHESRRIPDVGQAFMFHGFRFQILRRHRNQITSIKVIPPADPDPVEDAQGL
ncbi:MAG: HlyC/CorC family transporter [Rhodospirillales bacterium]